jgi:hypothetical protein
VIPGFLVAAAPGGGQELFNLSAGEEFSAICHFAQLSVVKLARAFRHGAERFLDYGQFA